MRFALLAYLTLMAPSLAAEPVALSLPVDCELGTTCHIQQFVDRDSGPGAEDYSCGALSYDGHKGTDFGLATSAQMQAGVDVLAAAPGVVAGTRDDMDDRLFSPESAAATEGRECGNGVVLRHPDGYETQYCHMRRGSIRVQSGDRVDRGAVLGQIGLSGRTQFPHLHLSVRREGAVVDPFDAEMSETCGDGRSLWQRALPYLATDLLDAGFAPGVPGYDTIQAGTAGHAQLPATASGLVLYGFAFGGQPGDVMTLTITGPDGPVSTQRMTIEKSQARYFRASGKRRATSRWPAGTYSGLVTLERNGQIVSERRASTTIP